MCCFAASRNLGADRVERAGPISTAEGEPRPPILEPQNETGTAARAQPSAPLLSPRPRGAGRVHAPAEPTDEHRNEGGRPSFVLAGRRDQAL
jgi:hypothetical protein